MCVVVFVFVWFVCDRTCDGVGRVVVDCLYACGTKSNKCVCVFCVGFSMCCCMVCLFVCVALCLCGLGV